MPASFVEVIDCLVDLVLRFEGPYKRAADEGAQLQTAATLSSLLCDKTCLLLIWTSLRVSQKTIQELPSYIAFQCMLEEAQDRAG